ncbi:leucine-rich repeat domain-containing protein [Porphyromonas canoris]|uniref:hypothetical protein n=1 Tax=Porphyromonas canoris TaxID=36875 RepID=UPI00068F92C4|nr:hypothetical protein [Porphyromonas canoris]
MASSDRQQHSGVRHIGADRQRDSALQEQEDSQSIDAEAEDRPDVWIDLNNNKVKDAGESVTTFDTDQEYILGAQTITVYGKIYSFHCSFNSLTTLDVSKNTDLKVLGCSDNSLTSLDVSKNTALTELVCFSNSLTSLDVSKNTTLTRLNCHSNSLASLDVSKNTALKELYCHSNSLTSLDVSKNTALTRLDCEDTPNLSSLKISRSINDALYIRNCKLSAETLNEIFRTLPDVKEQTEGKKKIWIADNPGTDACDKKIATDKGWKLDVEDTPPAGNSMTMTTEKAVGEKIELSINAEPADQADVWIDLNNNKVKDAGESVTKFDYEWYTLGSQTVTVHGKVTLLSCSSNSLTSLDVSKNTALEELSCHSNSLTSLDVSKNTALTRLSCSSNSLTSLDVSKNTALTALSCSSNSLASLDVSKNTALKVLDGSSNSLTSLDVSKNTALTALYCKNNPNLSSLKISSSINDELSVKSCKLSAETLNKIFRTLPDVKGQTSGGKKIWIGDNPGTAACNKKIAKDKGWTLDVGDTPPPPPAGNSMTMTTTLAVGEKITVKIYAKPEDRADVWIDLNNNGTKDEGEKVVVFFYKDYTLGSQTITIYGKVTEFHCHQQSLTSLDVSKNTALTELSCSDNSLTSLDLSKNTELEWLDCEKNSLTSLNVKNTALKALICNWNRLSSLNVSKNTALTRFSCENNPNLSSLKISSSINDELWVNGCKLSTETLNEIFRTLPDVKGQSTGSKWIWIEGNPGTYTCDKKIAEDKGWKLDSNAYKMTMTTTKAVGEKIELYIDTEPEYRSGVWIDLNNNGKEDNGENLVFGTGTYTLGSPTVTVYGKVTTFSCKEISLTSLDVSANTKLEFLLCNSNSLTSLDVSKNTALRYFDCKNNPNLSSLKISSSIDNVLIVRNCRLSTQTLNQIFRTLPDVTGQSGEVKSVWIGGNPGTDACNKKIAEDKGWTVKN